MATDFDQIGKHRVALLKAALLGLLAGLLLVGCQSDMSGGASGDMEEQPATAPEGGPGDTFADAEAEALVRAETRAVSAEAEFEAARDLMARTRYAEAEIALRRVLELDPYHQGAQDALREVQQILGVAPTDSVFERLVDEEQVRRQQIAAEIQERLRLGQEAYDTQDFETAVDHFESALQIIHFQPFHHDHRGLQQQATDMLERSRAGLREAELARERSIQEEASRMRMAEEQQRVEREEDRIRTLFEQGNKRFRQGNYLVARKIFEEILRLDPANQTADRLLEVAIEAEHARRRNESMATYIEEWQRHFERHRESEIFQENILEWPDDETWARIAGREPRRPSGIAEGVSPEDAAVMSRLSGITVNLDFQETPLEQVRSYLQEVSGVNIIIDPTVYEESDEFLVSISLSDLELDKALKLIMDLQDLAYRVEDGVLIISTPQQTVGEPILSLYDVRDLTGPLQDFPGPNIELTTEEDEGFGISLGEEEAVGTISEDELVDLIRNNVDPESWDEEGRAIEIRNRTLIARCTPDVHRELEKLLASLRESGGILVTIESRFLTVRDNFLESLGIDWRGLGDNLLLNDDVPTRSTYAPFDDVLTGIPAQPSAYHSLGASRSSGLYYDDGSDGDLRARVENVFDTLIFGDPRVLSDSGGLSLQYTILDDAELEFVVRAVKKTERVTLLTAPSVTTFNTQRAHVLVVNQIAYIKDYDVEVAQRAAIADPIIGHVQDGLVLDVRPIVSSDRRFITVELRPTVAELLRPIAVFETTLATGSVFAPPTFVQIQIPELTLQKVRTTVTVPDGGTIVIGGLKVSHIEDRVSSLPLLRNVPGGTFLFGKRGEYNHRRDLLVLITARITALSEQEPQPRLNRF